MPNDPFIPKELWLNRDEFSVRREIIPATSPRGLPPAQSKFLPSEFEDAHPWPLQWCGPEIQQGRFYGYKKFNASTQKRVENAGAWLAKSAKNEGGILGPITADEPL